METGGTLHYLSEVPPPGQGMYVVMRFLGLYAVVGLFLQAMLGLGGKPLQKLSGEWNIKKTHNRLGALTALLVCLHPLLFLLAIYARTEALAPAKLLIPFYANDYYHIMISFGMLGLYAMLLAVGAIIFRKKLPRSVYLGLHRFNYAVLPLAFYHSITIGSSTRVWPVLTLYVLLWSGLAMAAYMRFSDNIAKEKSLSCNARAGG